MLSQVSVGFRLAVGFALFLASVVIQGGISLYYLHNFNLGVEQMYGRELVTIKQLDDVKSRLYTMRLTLAGDGDAQVSAREGARVQSWVEARAREDLAPVETKLLGQFARNLTTFREALRSDPTSAVAAFTKVRMSLDGLIDYQNNLARTTEEYVKADYAHISKVLVALIVGFIVLSALGGLVVARSIVNPLRAALKLVQQAQQGDLTGRAQARGHDEPSRMLRAVNDMNVNLGALVDAVRDASDEVAHAAQEIAQGHNDLSQRTEAQASSLEQTAATMEELTAAVKQNAQSSDEASRFAAQTHDSAIKGVEAVNRVIATMTDIGATAGRMTEIVTLIDGIAFQTNILALNAAVESARAGEHGRGFGVVANEVRSLAMRAATAARDIKTLIEGAAERVAEGQGSVAEAGTRMDEIAHKARQTAEVVTHIASASAEQRAGIEQVNRTVTHLDELTQRNAALVEEATAASASLRELASKLKAMMQVFKTRPDAHVHETAAAAGVTNAHLAVDAP